MQRAFIMFFTKEKVMGMKNNEPSFDLKRFAFYLICMGLVLLAAACFYEWILPDLYRDELLKAIRRKLDGNIDPWLEIHGRLDQYEQNAKWLAISGSALLFMGSAVRASIKGNCVEQLNSIHQEGRVTCLKCKATNLKSNVHCYSCKSLFGNFEK